ncbi:Clavaminate synthase-like protein [Patellaria atrata CBS 101060]|uniref:Clavaminate synthase-like protein n=1 Tax=Patellaria atrata CBS 101060 TaxID=1346257 RepID=A0A9P4S3E3_9PEZI|nr:Clavaminate synthase-like protein [Patellaria atrata CBS 101060]
MLTENGRKLAVINISRAQGLCCITYPVVNEPFSAIPRFPGNVPTAPLLRISLIKLIQHNTEEEDRLWSACCDLGFFYLDLRSGLDSPITNIHGNGLLKDAESLFKVGEELFHLPLEEKVKYNLKDKGSYFGYKGYGSEVINKEGTKDRNEFYNVSKDDILGISEQLPVPYLLRPRRTLLESNIQHSHVLITVLLDLLNTRLDLPPSKLGSLHRLKAVSGDQVRFVKAPPQPPDDQRTALGAHSDFGSITVLFNRLSGLQVQLLPTVKSERPVGNPNRAVRKETDDGWAYVRPLPRHAIVNFRDTIVKFTARILRFNIHRVVSPPRNQASLTRYSLVYFARPEDNVPLKPLKASTAVKKQLDRGPRSEEDEEGVLTSKEWILRRALGRREGGNWETASGTESFSMRNPSVA